MNQTPEPRLPRGGASSQDEREREIVGPDAGLAPHAKKQTDRFRGRARSCELADDYVPREDVAVRHVPEDGEGGGGEMV